MLGWEADALKVPLFGSTGHIGSAVPMTRRSAAAGSAECVEHLPAGCRLQCCTLVEPDELLRIGVGDPKSRVSWKDDHLSGGSALDGLLESTCHIGQIDRGKPREVVAEGLQTLGGYRRADHVDPPGGYLDRGGADERLDGTVHGGRGGARDYRVP
jgi:hypothetical protein